MRLLVSALTQIEIPRNDLVNECEPVLANVECNENNLNSNNRKPYQIEKQHFLPIVNVVRYDISAKNRIIQCPLK